MRYSHAIIAGAFAQGALSAACKPLELVFARATGEFPKETKTTTTPQEYEKLFATPWSKGYGAAGYSVFGNLTKLLGADVVGGYPVHYPANTEKDSVSFGVKDMLSRLESQAKACPSQKFALSGHSQGSGVAAATIPKIPKDILARVVAVTMIGGRPCESLGLGARCQSYCHFNDCAGRTSTAPKDPKAPKGLSGPRGITPGWVADTCPLDADNKGDWTKVPEKGFKAKQFEGEIPHTAYNKDGCLVKTAAHFIADRFTKSK